MGQSLIIIQTSRVLVQIKHDQCLEIITDPLTLKVLAIRV